MTKKRNPIQYSITPILLSNFHYQICIIINRDVKPRWDHRRCERELDNRRTSDPGTRDKPRVVIDCSYNKFPLRPRKKVFSFALSRRRDLQLTLFLLFKPR